MTVTIIIIIVLLIFISLAFGILEILVEAILFWGEATLSCVGYFFAKVYLKLGLPRKDFLVEFVENFEGLERTMKVIIALGLPLLLVLVYFLFQYKSIADEVYFSLLFISLIGIHIWIRNYFKAVNYFGETYNEEQEFLFHSLAIFFGLMVFIGLFLQYIGLLSILFGIVLFFCWFNYQFSKEEHINHPDFDISEMNVNFSRTFPFVHTGFRVAEPAVYKSEQSLKKFSRWYILFFFLSFLLYIAAFYNHYYSNIIIWNVG